MSFVRKQSCFEVCGSQKKKRYLEIRQTVNVQTWFVFGRYRQMKKGKQKSRFWFFFSNFQNKNRQKKMKFFVCLVSRKNVPSISAYFMKAQIAKATYLDPELDSRKGPARSICTRQNTLGTTGMAMRGVRFARMLTVFNSLQTGHSLDLLRTQSCSPQK